MSARVYTRADAKTAQAQFERTGHAAFSGFYNPALAEPALAAAQRLRIARQGHNRTPGEYVTPLRVPRPHHPQEKSLYMLLQGVGKGIRDLLGRDIAPTSSTEREHYKFLEMDPNTEGSKHCDDPQLIDVVAVTNLRDRSHLWYEDGTVYDLAPGLTIVHDLAKNPLHGGFTDPGQSRVGLAIAKRLK